MFRMSAVNSASPGPYHQFEKLEHIIATRDVCFAIEKCSFSTLAGCLTCPLRSYLSIYPHIFKLEYGYKYDNFGHSRNLLCMDVIRNLIESSDIYETAEMVGAICCMFGAKKKCVPTHTSRFLRLEREFFQTITPLLVKNSLENSAYLDLIYSLPEMPPPVLP